VTLFDVNLLLYAYNTNAREHQRAARWLSDLLSGTAKVGLSWETILAFLRLATTPRLFARPLELDEALGIVGIWLALDNVVIVGPHERHWQILRDCFPGPARVAP
jgi:toxin-antitoxin system PIN domain toxin